MFTYRRRRDKAWSRELEEVSVDIGKLARRLDVSGVYEPEFDLDGAGGRS